MESQAVDAADTAERVKKAISENQYFQNTIEYLSNLKKATL